MIVQSSKYTRIYQLLHVAVRYPKLNSISFLALRQCSLYIEHKRSKNWELFCVKFTVIWQITREYEVRKHISHTSPNPMKNSSIFSSARSYSMIQLRLAFETVIARRDLPLSYFIIQNFCVVLFRCNFDFLQTFWSFPYSSCSGCLLFFNFLSGLNLSIFRFLVSFFARFRLILRRALSSGSATAWQGNNTV